MKRYLFALAVAAAAPAFAADQTVYPDGQERALPQATGSYVSPAAPSAWNERQRCTFEANLLQQAAWQRDRNMREHDAEASIAGVITKSGRYSPEFGRTAPARVKWIYANPQYSADDIQLGYLKECDPKHYANY
jgi:hypothetical protein